MVVSTGRGSLPAGHVAALTSQPYQPSAPAQCLAFWYQLSARTPGEHRDPPRGPWGHLRMGAGSHMAWPRTPPSMAGALGRLPRGLRGTERGAEEGDGCQCHGRGRLAPRPRHRLAGWGLAGETGQGAGDLAARRGNRLGLTRWTWRLPASACHPAHPSGRRYLRRWELGATTGTLRWMTCTCRTEPAPSQVRARAVGAPWTGPGGDGAPHGGTQPREWEQPVPTIMALLWPLGTLLLP